MKQPQLTHIQMIQMLRLVLDQQWLELGYERVTEEIPIPKQGKKNNLDHLYRTPLHPVRLWYGSMKKENINLHQLTATSGTLALYTLAQNLVAIIGCKNSRELIPRLKDTTQFFPTEFEIEVAASYRKKGYDVEFIDPATVEGKTPEMKVITPKNSTFYAECKWYNPQTKDAKKNKNLWHQLEQKILNHFINTRRYFALQLDASNGLINANITPLFNFIVKKTDLVDAKYQASSTPHMFDFEKSGRKYQIYLWKMATPDKPILSNHLNLPWSQAPYGWKVFSEFKKGEDGMSMYRNPLATSFTNLPDLDVVSRIGSQFKKAVKQLKNYQPGVIWIRIPDNSRVQSKFMENAKEIEATLKQKMIRNNRRVNAVIIVTKSYEHIDINGTQGMKIKPEKLIIEHSNPRFEIK